MSSAHIFLPLTAFILCAVAHLWALKDFPKLKLLDFPERYGHKRAPIPYPTGSIIVILFLVFLLTIQPWNKQTLGLVIGIVLLGTTCFFDDRKRLSPWFRFGIQILAGLLVFGFGTRIYTITNPLMADGILKLDSYVIPFALFDSPPVLSGIFTIAWLGLTINALNWFDGIPGQVSLLSFIGFLTIGLLAVSPRIEHLNPELQAQLGLLAFVLAALALAGFLFDFPPARVLMGDTGAMFFGLMLGVLTIYAGGKVATAFLVLGVPLIDSGLVIARRLRKGVSVASNNTKNEHLHHRLLAKGWKEGQVILLTAGLGTAFGVTALFLSTTQKIAAGFVLLLVMVWLSWYSR